MAREGQGYPCYQHDMMMMKAGLNSEFPSTRMVTKPKLKNPVLSSYFLIGGEEKQMDSCISQEY